MFLKTSAIAKTVTSGSLTTGSVVDISDYKHLWVEQLVSGSIAGTGSLYITSIAESDLSPTGMVTEPTFSAQPAVLTLTGDGGSGWAYVSSSVTSIDAKWATFKFQETSGSAQGTGSVVVKFSLLK